MDLHHFQNKRSICCECDEMQRKEWVLSDRYGTEELHHSINRICRKTFTLCLVLRTTWHFKSILCVSETSVQCMYSPSKKEKKKDEKEGEEAALLNDRKLRRFSRHRRSARSGGVHIQRWWCVQPSHYQHPGNLAGHKRDFMEARNLANGRRNAARGELRV